MTSTGHVEASSFSCIEKRPTETGVGLRVSGTGIVAHVIKVLPSTAPNNSYAIEPIDSTYNADATAGYFVYTDLQPGTSYRVRAFDGAGTMVQDIGNCSFVTTVLGTTPSSGSGTPAVSTASGDECTDGKDNQIGDGKDYGYGTNNGDRKADRYGTLEFEPDPACFAKGVTIEKGDDLAYNTDGTPASVIPCTNKCTLNDVFRLLNNIIAFFFKVLLIPIFVIMIMYAGYKYIAAQGNSGKIANLKRMLGYFIGGILLILCAWLIVRTIMNTLLNDQFKQSGVELLGE